MIHGVMAVHWSGQLAVHHLATTSPRFQEFVVSAPLLISTIQR
jgi:hypothetical protein